MQAREWARALEAEYRLRLAQAGARERRSAPPAAPKP
jgi:hypothetical protein